jgi:hypothetical protein
MPPFAARARKNSEKLDVEASLTALWRGRQAAKNEKFQLAQVVNKSYCRNGFQHFFRQVV